MNVNIVKHAVKIAQGIVPRLNLYKKYYIYQRVNESKASK